jgi:hypothetical protein
MSGEIFLTLAKKMVFWKLEASAAGDIDSALSLNEKIPVWMIEASVLPGVSLVGDAEMPVWLSEAYLYSGDMGLDVTIPIWVMHDDPGGIVDGSGGEMTDRTRFTDFILRYQRK